MGTFLIWLVVLAICGGTAWWLWRNFAGDEDNRAKHLYGVGKDGKPGNPSLLLQIWWWLVRNTWGRLRNWWLRRHAQEVHSAPSRQEGQGSTHNVAAQKYFQNVWDTAGSGDQASPQPPAPLPPPPSPEAADPSGNGHAPEPADGDGGGMGGTQADLIHAIHSLVARGLAGDIHVKRRVIGTFAVISEAMGSGLHRFGARLSEPDQHYGNEIFEPLLSAGAQNRAASLQIGQADGAIRSLMNTSVGELAASPRRAPHHADLNGGR